MKMKYTALTAGLCATLFMSSCAGGGGSVHIPPKSIRVGQPTTLTMELTSWGAGSGKLSKRYTEIQCHFRIAGTEDYSVVRMTPIAETSERLTVQCSIPPMTAKPGDKLEYYIDHEFDGVYNKRIESPVPFE
jgi:hypothetical protein